MVSFVDELLLVESDIPGAIHPATGRQPGSDCRLQLNSMVLTIVMTVPFLHLVEYDFWNWSQRQMPLYGAQGQETRAAPSTATEALLLESGHPVTVAGSNGRTYVLQKRKGFYSWCDTRTASFDTRA